MGDRVHAESDVPALLRERGLPEWSLDAGTIRREYATKDFPHTMLLVNAIAYLAEAAFHHPDLEVSYAKVVVRLSTHSAGGITDKDLDLAASIEAVGA